jgi:hypothetical protein
MNLIHLREPYTPSFMTIAKAKTPMVVRVGESHVRVGAIWLPFVAAAYLTKGYPAPKFGEDTRSYLAHIDSGVDQLWEDVLRDACKFGADREADGETYPVWSAAVCTKVGYPKAPPPGTHAHITSEWLRMFNWWIQDWRKYMNEQAVDFPGYRPDRPQLDAWYTQLEGTNGWRDQLTKAGAKVIGPSVPKPEPKYDIPWKWILGIAALATGAYIVISLKSIILPAAAVAKAS